MAGAIEALYIYDEHTRPILTHTYKSRPLSAAQLLPLYLAHPTPRPNLIYLPNTSPSTLVFSVSHSNLLFLSTSSAEIEPLLVLEFLHRVIDVFEEFLGAPLLAHKIEANYDVVAQLLNEMCDAGAISTTEPNALREVVEVEGWIGKLLGGISIPGKPGFTAPSSSTSMSGMGSISGNTPALPWRRPNVRHTSNEIYVDFVETLSMTIAPSGRALSAFANGTIACTSKISGVPDILLNLSTPSGKQNVESVIELPVFHPCVRLARWREKPGELSFVPPDGRFILAGYQVDLLPTQWGGARPGGSKDLRLPFDISIQTGLGSTGSEFEVQLTLKNVAGQGNSSVSGPSSRGASHLGTRSAPPFGGGSSSAAGMLDDVLVKVSLPPDVRNLSEIHANKGDTTYNRADQVLEWQLLAKDCAPGINTLRCNVFGALSDDGDTEGNGFRLGSEWDYTDDAYQSSPTQPRKGTTAADGQEGSKKLAQNKILMPRSINLSFSCKGWLASGIKVESLVVDPRKSRGLGDGVKPYKGVKYLTLSRGGVDKRC